MESPGLDLKSPKPVSGISRNALLIKLSAAIRTHFFVGKANLRPRFLFSSPQIFRATPIFLVSYFITKNKSFWDKVLVSHSTALQRTNATDLIATKILLLRLFLVGQACPSGPTCVSPLARVRISSVSCGALRTSSRTFGNWKEWPLPKLVRPAITGGTTFCQFCYKCPRNGQLEPK